MAMSGVAIAAMVAMKKKQGDKKERIMSVGSLNFSETDCYSAGLYSLSTYFSDYYSDLHHNTS